MLLTMIRACGLLLLIFLTRRNTFVGALVFGPLAKSCSIQTHSPIGSKQFRPKRRTIVFSSSSIPMDNSEVHKSPLLPIVANSAEVVSTSPVVKKQLNAWQSLLTQIGMRLFVVSMCLALPLTLLPQELVYRMGLMTTAQKERYALTTGQFCARWLLRLIPFCRVSIYASHHPIPPESIWVCNHSSMLDVFILLAVDQQLRGKNKRPIKVVYWKQLEKNPICKLFFQQAGFIPVQMEDNGTGNDNNYDKKSFKQLLKDSKQAFLEGFDIGILPEGQLNPNPEKSLMPVFPGAFHLAKMSKRPIQMMALSGVHDLWHPIHGMHCVGRHIRVRAFPYMFRFASASDFVSTFTQMVGHFAIHGNDLPPETQNELLVNNLLAQSK